MKKFILTFFILAITNANAQTYSSIVPDSIIDNFMEWKTKSDTLNLDGSKLKYDSFCTKVLSFKAFDFYFDSTSKNFNNKKNLYSDMKLFFEENKKVENFKFFKTQLINSKIFNWNFSLNNQDKSLKKPAYSKCIHFISLPIFSIDYSKAIFIDFVHCPFDGGGYEIKLYDKKNGEWKFAKCLLKQVL